MKRNLTALLLAAATLISTTASATDLYDHDLIGHMDGWFIQEYIAAREIGLIPDFHTARFTDNIQRDKFCEFAVTLMQKKDIDTTAAGENPFTDTTDENVIFLAETGVIYGRGYGIFAPEDKITREEAAAILCRMADYMEFAVPEGDDFVYADDESISDWAKESVYGARYMGVMLGTGDTEFSPKAPYTIEQTTATMLRLYNYGSTGVSQADASMPTPAPKGLNDKLIYGRSKHESLTVGDNVYVIGGVNNNYPVGSIEVCSGGSGKWSYETDSEHLIPGIAAATDGRNIYIIGGGGHPIYFNGSLDTVSAYDTETKQWRDVGRLGEPIAEAKAAYLDGKLYITDGNDKRTERMLIYDIATDTTETVSYPKLLHNAIPIAHKGSLYIFEGKYYSTSHTGLSTTYIYSNGEWAEMKAAPQIYTMLGGQSDGEKIYLYGNGDSLDSSILEYDAEADSWRVIMDGYIREKRWYSIAFCKGYAYVTGGSIERYNPDMADAEPYYYKWTYADYNPDDNPSFKNTMGFDYEPNGKTYETLPEIVSVKATAIDKDRRLFSIKVYGSCDSEATPYYFWESTSGCFDGANTDYSRVIFHSDTDYIQCVVGIGDGSGQTDRRKVTIPSWEIK